MKATVHAPGEGARSVKRQKQEEKLGWGLTTVRPSLLLSPLPSNLHSLLLQAKGLVYTPLHDLPLVHSEAARLDREAAYQRRLVNVVGFVETVGEVFPPRQSDGSTSFYLSVLPPSPKLTDLAASADWYRKFTLSAPPPPGAPTGNTPLPVRVDMNFYSLTEEGIPKASEGDLIILQWITVHFLSLFPSFSSFN